MITCSHRVEALAISGLPLVERGDDVPALVAGALRAAGLSIAHGDVIVVTSKLLSRAEGRFVDLPGVEPLAVPVDAGAHLIDVGLRLAQRALEVALLGLEGGDGVAQPGVTLLELVEFRVLGEAPASVLEPR